MPVLYLSAVDFNGTTLALETYKEQQTYRVHTFYELSRHQPDQFTLELSCFDYTEDCRVLFCLGDDMSLD